MLLPFLCFDVDLGGPRCRALLSPITFDVPAEESSGEGRESLLRLVFEALLTHRVKFHMLPGTGMGFSTRSLGFGRLVPYPG